MVISRALTIDDLSATTLPANWELVKGEIIEVTPSSGRSARIGGRIYALFLRDGEDRGLGWASPAETGFMLFGDRQTVRSPDAAFVLRYRLAAEPAEFVPLAPDLAVEVLSPSDRMADALAKVAIYLDAGVRLAWLVDPPTQTVTVFHPSEPPTKLGVGDTLDGGDVLPDFRLPVAEIFA
jgi:Uma2 family endonuclease